MTRPDDLARHLARLSSDEIAEAALGANGNAPLKRLVSLAFAWPSHRLGRTLAHFDERTRVAGLSRAARETLERLGASLHCEGAPPRGPAVVVVNHPGAYDALALMTALARDDVFFVAGERAFLRALPNVARHLAFVGPESVAGVKRALAAIRDGGVVVQFGAGAIEPDVAFDRGAPLGEWRAGTGLIAARAVALGAQVIPTFVHGVHSPRAKRLALVKWAERRGTTTIAPLLQATLPGFRDVRVTVRFGPAVDIERSMQSAAVTARVRDAVGRLSGAPVV